MDYQWLSEQEMRELIRQNEALQEEIGNRQFKYFYPEYIHGDELLAAFDEGKLVGLAQVGPSAEHREEKTFSLKFVCTHPSFQRQGIARELLQKIIARLSKIDGARFYLSSYMEEGEVLIPLIESLAVEYPAIEIFHRTVSSPYQNARRPFLRVDDEVLTPNGQRGKIRYLHEYEGGTATVTLATEEVALPIAQLQKI